MVKEKGMVEVESEVGGSIQPTDLHLEAAKKIISENDKRIERLGTNGPVLQAFKTDHYAFMKHFLKGTYGDVFTNKMITDAQNLFILGIMAFTQLGASLTFVRFGTFRNVMRAERTTSHFGQRIVKIPAKAYFEFHPGKEATGMAASAPTATPKGRLRDQIKEALANGNEVVIQATAVEDSSEDDDGPVSV